MRFAFLLWRFCRSIVCKMPFSVFVRSFIPDLNKGSAQGRLKGMSPRNDRISGSCMKHECKVHMNQTLREKKWHSKYEWNQSTRTLKSGWYFCVIPFSVAVTHEDSIFSLSTRESLAKAPDTPPHSYPVPQARKPWPFKLHLQLFQCLIEMLHVWGWWWLAPFFLRNKIPLQTGEVVGFGRWRFPFHDPDHNFSTWSMFTRICFNWVNMSQPPFQ